MNSEIPKAFLLRSPLGQPNNHDKTKTLKLFAVLLAVCILSACTNNYSAESSSSGWSHVLSHRGASGEEIEHTVKAYDLAILYGSHYIEQDVVTSQDSTLWVSHDASAKRITGVDKPFSEMTDSEIAELRTEDGQSLLRMEDVLDRYGDSVTYVVELKEDERQLQLFCSLITKTDMKDHIILQCFKPEVLENAEAVFPDMEKILLVDNQNSIDKAVLLPYVDDVGVSVNLMTAENIQKVHDSGKLFIAWTLNSTTDIERAISLDVDSYFTNFTAKALALEEKYRHKDELQTH